MIDSTLTPLCKDLIGVLAKHYPLFTKGSISEAYIALASMDKLLFALDFAMYMGDPLEKAVEAIKTCT